MKQKTLIVKSGILVLQGGEDVNPPETRQRITNTGDIDLIFLAVCTPRFNRACYEDLDSG